MGEKHKPDTTGKWKKTVKIVLNDDIIRTKSFINALEINDLKTVRRYLEDGQDPNTHTDDYLTGLHIAATNGYLELAILLLQQPKINIDFQDSFGLTPINNAAKSNQYEIAKLFIKYKANLNIPDKFEYTPLHNACLWQYTEIAELLIANNADVNLQTCFGKTPLFISCVDAPNMEITKMLISANADINLNTGKTMPILLECALACYSYKGLQMIELLLFLGADINIQDCNTSQSALHIAALTNNLTLAEVLCTSGADITLRDNQNRTARDVAAQKKSGEVLAFFDFLFLKFEDAEAGNEPCSSTRARSAVDDNKKKRWFDIFFKKKKANETQKK